jgi:hypothetical protein
MELGQGERCGCDHVSAKPLGARLKYQESGGLEELDSREESPGTQPENQKRFDQFGCGFLFNPYPAALTSDLLPMLLRGENDDVVLHNDYVDFSNRTQEPGEKLQNSLSLFFTADVCSPLASLRQTWDELNRGVRRFFLSPAKVSFDAQGFVAIAFPPQIQVRWLSGRKRRFAKALYL